MTTNCLPENSYYIKLSPIVQPKKNQLNTKIRMKKLAFLSAVILAFALQNASAQYTTNVLFTTVNDFSLFSGSGGGNSTVATSAFDADGSTVNGLGNIGGGTGTGGGSLQITWGSGGYNEIVVGPSQGSNPAFLSAIDPGSSGNTAVAYSGIIQMIYSLPTPTSGGTYFQAGVFFQYSGNGYYGPELSGSTSDLGYTDPYGQEVYQATIPYTITAGSFNGFGFGLFVNSNYAPALFPFYVDDITSLTPVPEPGTMALVGMGTLAFGFLARRRRV
jgi:hypothetical protein